MTLSLNIRNLFNDSSSHALVDELRKRTSEKEILDFVRSINGEDVDHANVDDGLHALKSGLAANKSLFNNKLTMV